MLVGVPLLRVFDRMGCGGIILSTTGQVLATNTSARLILQQMFELDNAAVAALDGSGREIVKHLLNHGRTRIHLDGENWILIERNGQRPLIMNCVPVPVLSEDGPHSVLLLIDLDATPLPSTGCLEQIFGLTPAEARLTLLLVDGKTLDEIAHMRHLSVATVRTQLKAVFEKTHTHRQAELVVLVSRLAALP
ncbi:helix-turn-helix transcriptional regulator [Methylobacterium longum]|uniref:Helix-turn-helix transcriptional regulator n=1 Tax=Methylobacterium longum TaxID=767694 RepID=A0ABT8AZH0_9HYPH|nr:helix-turn-helix transcriptional regulator [Methylobacterium longum]MDN3575007.1 helix-turn-helix transcriptional regulator [Methylobacterium longum]